jgi:hypothetical protein
LRQQESIDDGSRTLSDDASRAGASPHSEPALAQSRVWACPTCRASVATPFCPGCGERQPHPDELTLRGFTSQAFAAVTDVDGRLIRTLRALVARPGALTLAYLEGNRKPFIAPVPLFLIANFLFFATESLTGGKVFTTPLASHLHTQPWSGFAQELIARRLEASHTTLALYAPVFDRAVAVNARSLILLMTLAFTPVVSLVFRRSGRPVVAHAAFSIHVYAYLLLLLSVATTVPAIESWIRGGAAPSDALDHALSISLVLACAAYLFAATRTVYGASGVVRVLATAVLAISVAAIVLAYRFALLLITLFTA